LKNDKQHKIEEIQKEMIIIMGKNKNGEKNKKGEKNEKEK